MRERKIKIVKERGRARGRKTRKLKSEIERKNNINLKGEKKEVNG
jgi:hypothetical protein